MQKKDPVLIVFGGLPGVGKTTIARQLAERCGATFLRLDEIEQLIRLQRGVEGDVGPDGYIHAYATAETNLKLGLIVIADCVNPLAITRNAWRATATSAGARIIEVEIKCSDLVEHRRRAERRTSDIAGFVLPSWSAIRTRRYKPWDEPHIVIDTAGVSADEAVTRILAALDDPSTPAQAQ